MTGWGGDKGEGGGGRRGGEGIPRGWYLENPSFYKLKLSHLNVLKIENRNGFDLLMATQICAKYMYYYAFFYFKITLKAAVSYTI